MYGPSRYPDSPHGGWLETCAKIAFASLLVAMLLVKVTQKSREPKPEPVMNSTLAVAIFQEATRVRDNFLAKDGKWTPEEAAVARNKLIEMEELFPSSYVETREAIGKMRREVVEAAWSESRRDQMTALSKGRDLRNAYSRLPPKGAEPLTAHDGWDFLAWIGLGLLKLYLLFIPFAFASYLARLRKLGYSFVDEMVFGWRNLLFSTVVWPAGMADYPSNTALALRRRFIEAEYRVRIGKTGWNDELSRAQRLELEALILAPKTELAARLNEMADIPAHALWRARVAVYAATFVGILAAPFSTARAQSSGDKGDGEERPAAAEVEGKKPEPKTEEKWSAKGFIQLDGSLTKPSLDIGLARVFVNGKPTESVNVNLGLNLAPKFEPLDIAVGYTPWKTVPIQITVGQFVQRSAFLVPAPQDERLIGGPEAGKLFSYFDIGAQVSGTHRFCAWSLAAISGSGKNQVDNNAAKDVVAWFASGPFGPLKFQLAWQGGQQPDGFRMRSAASTDFNWKQLTFSLLVAHELAQWRSASARHERLAGSALLGWRAHTHLDLAVGADSIVDNQAAPERMFRAQSTFLALDDRFRIGAMYRFTKSNDKEHAGLLRIQANF